MISGSTRYARQLGFFGGLGVDKPSTVKDWERALGVDFSGKAKWVEGADADSRIIAGLSPSNFLMIILGAGLGATLSSRKRDGSVLKGTIGGALAGAIVAGGVRTAGAWGI